MKPTTDEVLSWAREAGFEVYEEDKFCNAHITDTLVHIHTAAEALATIAYAAGAKAMQERCAKVCADATMGTNVALVGVGFAEAIRALGDNDD